jgi:hypothetical protein
VRLPLTDATQQRLCDFMAAVRDSGDYAALLPLDPARFEDIIANLAGDQRASPAAVQKRLKKMKRGPKYTPKKARVTRAEQRARETKR